MSDFDALWDGTASKPAVSSSSSFDEIWGSLDPTPNYHTGNAYLDTAQNIGQSIIKGATPLVGMAADYNPFSVEGNARIGNAAKKLWDWATVSEDYLKPKQPDTYEQYLNATAISPQLEQVRKEQIGNPYARNGLERYTNKAFEMLPSALSLQPEVVAGALMSGAGGEGAKDLGLPEWSGQVFTPLAASMLKSGAQAAIRPFTSSGQKILAGRELLANAGKQGEVNLLAALKGFPEGSEFGPITYAEMAKTPSAAAFQEAVRKIPGEGSNAIEANLLERQLNRTKALESVAPEAFSGATPDVRGAFIRNETAPIADEAITKAEQLFTKIDPKRTTRIDVSGSQDFAIKEFEKRFGSSPLGVSKDTDKILNYIAAKPVMTWSEVSGLRQDLGRLAQRVADSKEAGLLTSIRDNLLTSVDNAAKNNAGMTKEQASKYFNAINTYKDAAENFQQGVGAQIVGKGAYGRFPTPESAIPKTVIRSPESAKQFMKAFGDKPELVQQARASLIEDLPKDFGRWDTYYQKNSPQFKAIFGEDLDRVQQVLSDIKTQTSVGEMATRASKGQSFTTQGTTVLKSLINGGPRSVLKSLGGSNGAAVGATAGSVMGSSIAGPIGGFIGAAAGVGASKAAKWSNEAIQKIITQAIADPELLRVITQKTSEKGIKEAAIKLAPTLATYYSTQSAGDLTQKNVDDLASQFAPANSQQPGSVVSQIPESQSQVLKSLVQASPALITSTDKQQAISKNQFDNPSPNSAPGSESSQAQSEDHPLRPLFNAVIKQESGGKKDAVSYKGATGLMQIMPSTAKEIAKELGIRKYDLKDPETNKKFGEHYLTKMLKKFNGDIELALAAYNAGEGQIKNLLKVNNVKTWDQLVSILRRKHPSRLVAKETIPYVRNIMKNLQTELGIA